MCHQFLWHYKNLILTLPDSNHVDLHQDIVSSTFEELIL